MSSMGITATVASHLSQLGFNSPFSIATIGALGSIGASSYAEDAALINEDRIVSAVNQLVSGSRA